MDLRKLDLERLPAEGIENVPVQERRDFLKMGLAITGIFAGGTIFSAISTANRIFASAEEHARKYPYKPHYSFIMQQNRCIDCELCLAACRKTNHVPDYGYRTTILEHEESDAVGQKREFIPVLCNQCNLPQCVTVCPTRATYKDKTHGIVLMDSKKCIGCLTCQQGCPYNARYFNEERKAVDKCNFCFDTRLSKGVKLPACAAGAACPADVRVFGDLADQSSRVYQLVHQLEKAVWVHRPQAGTHPNVFFTRG
jgi:protein NrfC